MLFRSGEGSDLCIDLLLKESYGGGGGAIIYGGMADWVCSIAVIAM